MNLEDLPHARLSRTCFTLDRPFPAISGGPLDGVTVIAGRLRQGLPRLCGPRKERSAPELEGLGHRISSALLDI